LTALLVGRGAVLCMPVVAFQVQALTVLDWRVQTRLLRIVEASGAAPQRWEPAVVQECVKTHLRLVKDVSDVFDVSDVLPLGPLSASIVPPTAADR